MKSIFTLLLLTNTFVISSPIPAHMLKKTPAQLNLIFSRTIITERESRPEREVRRERDSRPTREAREFRFVFADIAKQREIRISRIEKDNKYIKEVKKKEIEKSIHI